MTFSYHRFWDIRPLHQPVYVANLVNWLDGTPVAPSRLFRKEKSMKPRVVFLSIILGGTVLALPITPVPAADKAEDMKAAANPSDYSDRDRMKSSTDEKKALEQALPAGQEKGFYRTELEKLGWQITAVNYDKPDYLEYEIVKGQSTYEVQVAFDKASHKSTKVEVGWNMWKADATKNALKGQKVEYPKKTTANPTRYSDRDMVKSSKSEKTRLEQGLKLGEDKDFYRRELQKMGWQITSTNYDKPEYVEWEIVKGRSTYEVQIDLDKNSHKATKIDVSYNLWHADATDKALERGQEHAQR